MGKRRKNMRNFRHMCKKREKFVVFVNCAKRALIKNDMKLWLSGKDLLLWPAAPAVYKCTRLNSAFSVGSI